ncbi:MAG: thiamine pyrophosphate-binding protein [Patescibacteria group bacterium]
MIVADYILKFFEEKEVEAVFMVAGGQSMFLNDAIYRSKKIKVICSHHEQAAGMAAEAYGRLKKKPAIAMVTAGPGAVNVINGVVGGWVDSSPMIIISGQTNLAFVDYQEKNKIRQVGVQGINIKPLVKDVVKFFVTVDNPANLLYYLEKAYYLAMNGRPGPVWLDVPLDIQRAEVPEKPAKIFNEQETEEEFASDKGQIAELVQMLLSAKRPILLVGQGIKLGSAEGEFENLINLLKIPILTARLAIDLIDSEHKLYVGRPGTYGERAANFAIQNSDLIVVVGCRLATSLVGHNPKDFGRNAKKIVVDVDQKELDKPGVEIDLKIKSTAKKFLQTLLEEITDKKLPDWGGWVRVCKAWRIKYPVVQPSYKNEKPVNSYYFTDKLSAAATKDDWILVDTGSCFHVACQTWKIKKGQKFLTTGGFSTMGYWAAGIGACVANDRKNTIVITGDGSLQMNLQELATVKHNNLPLKIFIFNNNGYLLMRLSQANFMNKHLIGESPATGLWCPDSLKIAEAYGIKGVRIDSVDGIDEKIAEVLSYDGPVICDVMTPEWQILAPRTMSDKLPDGRFVPKPYEDMYPFLDPAELKQQMVTDLEKEAKTNP